MPRVSALFFLWLRLKARNDPESVITMLDVAIDGLNLAYMASSATPAGPVFGSVGVILVIIRVRFLFSVGELSPHVYLGLHGQPARLRRGWIVLRRNLQRTQTGNRWEERGRP